MDPITAATDESAFGPAIVPLDHSLFEVMVSDSADGMIAVDAAGLILYVNTAAAELLGRPSHALLGAQFGLPMATEQAEEVDLFHPVRGRIVAELRVAHAAQDISVAMLRDVSVRVELREELERMALTDTLTGVGNRRGFLALGEQALRIAEREGYMCTLMFVDIDRMKDINDTHGHAAGDDALIATANMLRSTVRDADVVARIGGDEFCVLQTASSEEALDDAVNRVREAAAQVHTTVDFPLAVTLGVTNFRPDDGRSLAAVMDEADEKMYDERRRSRSGLVVSALASDACIAALDRAFGPQMVITQHTVPEQMTVLHDDMTASVLVVDAGITPPAPFVQRHRLRASSRHIPIVVWLDEPDSAIERDVLLAGADDVIVATMHPDVQQARMQRLSRRP